MAERRLLIPLTHKGRELPHVGLVLCPPSPSSVQYYFRWLGTQPLEHFEGVTEVPSPFSHPLETLFGRVLYPECVASTAPCVLRRVVDYEFLEDILGEDPAACIERSNAQANGNLVVLITKLLKRVAAILPPRRELDLGCQPTDYPIMLGASSLGYVKSFGCAPSRNQLFPNLADLS